MADVEIMYAVVDRDRRIRRNRHRCPMIYDKLSTAQRQATGEGDSVVEVMVDFGRAPLFIRQKTL